MHSKRAITVVELLIGICVTVLLISVIVLLSRAQSRYGTFDCKNQLETIGYALSEYLQEFSRLPPCSSNSPEPSQSSRSWRVEILLDWDKSGPELAAYHRDEPWDSGHNLKLANAKVLGMNHLYHCPNDSSPKYNTSYLAVRGEHSWFDAALNGDLSETSGAALRFHRTQKNKPDPSLGNAIILLEVHNSGIHWMEPRDIFFSDLASSNKPSASNPLVSGHTYFSNRERSGTFALFGDGRVEFINSNIDSKVLQSLIEINDPDKP